MTSGELFEGKDYLSTAASHFTASSVEAIDPLYQYLDLQTLIEKISVRLAESYSIQRVQFRASDFHISVEHQSCGLCTDSTELSLPMNFQSNSLGTLTLRRGDRFSERESQALASEAQALSGPCNNALLYAHACYSACHDELTGLFNRSVLKSPLLNPLTNAWHETLVLLVCDIDHFKSINDNHGHAVGDAVLHQFSAKLQSIISNKDLVVRYGGDEFVIAISNSNADDLRDFIEHLRQSIEFCKFEVQGVGVDVTTTIGVTARRQEEPIESTILRADTALLEGKKAGRNRVVWL